MSTGTEKIDGITDLVIHHLQNEGFGTIGSNLFTEFIPNDVKSGILALQPPSGVTRDPYLPNFYRSGFQIIVRDKNWADSNRIAKQLLTLFEKGGIIEIGGWRLRSAHASHEPIHYRVSDGKLFEHSVNFEAVFDKV